MDAAVVERIASDDRLVAQPFFWSAPGIKLFGDHVDLQDPQKLAALLEAALQQQPAILSAFLHSAAAKAGAAPAAASAKSLCTVCRCAVLALCDHVRGVGIVGHSMNPSRPINEAVAVLLELATKYPEHAYEAVLAGCDDADDAATALLDAFAASYFRQKVGITARSSMSITPVHTAGLFKGGLLSSRLLADDAPDAALRLLADDAPDAALPPALQRACSAEERPTSGRPHSSNATIQRVRAVVALERLPRSLLPELDEDSLSSPLSSAHRHSAPEILLAPAHVHAGMHSVHARAHTHENLLAPHSRLNTPSPKHSPKPSSTSSPPGRSPISSPTLGARPGRSLAATRFATAVRAMQLVASPPALFSLNGGGGGGGGELDEHEAHYGGGEDDGGPEGSGSSAALSPREETRRNERVVMALANLFVARPEKLTAFGQLVPHVFDTYLTLGSAPRAQLNALLLEKAFDENLERLFTESDDLVKAPFFWHHEVIPLCTKARIRADYPTLNQATLTTPAGVLHLYSRLLALLLKLASAGTADATEIAGRTKEVLDQCECAATGRPMPTTHRPMARVPLSPRACLARAGQPPSHSSRLRRLHSPHPPPPHPTHRPPPDHGIPPHPMRPNPSAHRPASQLSATWTSSTFCSRSFSSFRRALRSTPRTLQTCRCPCSPKSPRTACTRSRRWAATAWRSANGQ